jgi:hypothetical protein
LIPVGTGFKKYQHLEIEKLAEPPAQEAPSQEEELEAATKVAEAAGAQSPDEIETTVGDSQLVAELLGEEQNQGGNGGGNRS